MHFEDLLNTDLVSWSSDTYGWININNTTWTPERPGDTIEGELVEMNWIFAIRFMHVSVLITFWLI